MSYVSVSTELFTNKDLSKSRGFCYMVQCLDVVSLHNSQHQVLVLTKKTWVTAAYY